MTERRRAPSNRRQRAQRIAHWNESREAGRAFRPSKAAGKDARYTWIKAMLESDLASTTRLAAFALSTHGLADGTRIFPGIRLLARETRLSARAVSEHLDILVRRGFLAREARSGDTAGARGFTYTLLVPGVLTDDAHKPRPTRAAARTKKASVLTQDQQQTLVRTDDQHSVDPDAVGVHRDDSSVCILRSPSSPVITHIVPHEPRSARAIPSGSRSTRDQAPVADRRLDEKLRAAMQMLEAVPDHPLETLAASLDLPVADLEAALEDLGVTGLSLSDLAELENYEVTT